MPLGFTDAEGTMRRISAIVTLILFAACGGNEEPTPVNVNVAPPGVTIEQGDVNVHLPQTSTTAPAPMTESSCAYQVVVHKADYQELWPPPKKVARGDGFSPVAGQALVVCGEPIYARAIVFRHSTPAALVNLDLWAGGQRVQSQIVSFSETGTATWNLGRVRIEPGPMSFDFRLSGTVRPDAMLGYHSVEMAALVIEDENGNPVTMRVAPAPGLYHSYEVAESTTPECSGQDCCHAGTIWDENVGGCVDDPRQRGGFCIPNSIVEATAPGSTSNVLRGGDTASVVGTLAMPAASQQFDLARIQFLVNGPDVGRTFVDATLRTDGQDQGTLMMRPDGWLDFQFGYMNIPPAGTTVEIQLRISSQPNAGIYTITMVDMRATGSSDRCRLGHTGIWSQQLLVGGP